MPAVPPDDPQASHVCRLWRCFLCLERLLYEHSAEHPQWRSELISLLPCTASDGSIRALLEITDVDSVWSEPHKPRWATDALGVKHFVRFCDYALDGAMFCDQRDPDRVIFYAHRCCWKVANVPVLNDPLVLLRFAFQTRPFENWPIYDQSHDFHAQDDPSIEPPSPEFDLGTNDLLPFDTRHFSNTTDLGRLVSRLGKMPLEIQFQVTKRLKLTLFKSLLKAKALVTQLLPHISESAIMKPKIRTLDTDGSLKFIHARYRNFMGKSYLAAICFKTNGGGDASSISVANHDIRGVQFSLGRFGVRGIRVLYEDETCSQWLGESSSGWIGVAFGNDLSQLRVVADVRLFPAEPSETRKMKEQEDFEAYLSVLIYFFSQALRIIRLDFLKNFTISPKRIPVMWYGHFHPSDSLVNRMFPPPHPHGQQWVRQLDYYRGWRQCQYLALSTASGYTSGLTVYLDHRLENLTGIVSHGHQNLALGSPWGIPIHFSLSTGEHLTSAWLHVWGYHYGGVQCLSVTTNYGRVRHFGNYRVVRQHHCEPQPRGHDTPCRWIRISDDHPARIDGIFIDANEYLKRGGMINTIGVAQNKQLSQVEGGTDAPGPTYLEIPSSIAAPPERPFSLSPGTSAFFYSTASLTNILQVRVRKHGGRYLGVHFSYEDSTVETLGQWDPADRDSILKIYDAIDGVLTRLNFHIKLEDNCLRKPQIELVSVEVAASSWQPQLPEESTSDHANNSDYDSANMSIDEFGSFCGRCGSSKCCDSTLRRECKVKAFGCFQAGQRVVWWSGVHYETVSLDDGLPQDRVRPASKVTVNWSPPRVSGKDSSKPPHVVVG